MGVDHSWCDMIFSQWKVKDAWWFSDILLPNKFGTFLMCFTRCCDTWYIFGKSVYKMVDLIVFPFISRGDRTLVYLWQVWVSRVELANLVSLYITHRSNTELERMDIFVVDMDDYFDPKIIIFDQVFIACLMSFRLEIVLSHLIIFPSHFNCSLLKRKAWIIQSELSAYS